MFVAILAAAMPFILNGIIGIAKYAAISGASTGWKRATLAFFALVGVVSAAAVNGTPLDVVTVQGFVETIALTFGAFVASHGTYSLFFQKKA